MNIRLSLILLALVLLPFTIKGQALSGTKTIGGTLPDYATFSDAVTALITNGIAGVVTFDVRSGTYAENINILAISGTGSGNEIIFKSETGNNTDVVITYAPTTNPENYTIWLNGADYITFRDMTISSTGSSYARVIVLTGGAHNNNFLNNRIIGAQTTSDLEIFALIDSYADFDTANVFSENYLLDGSYGVYYVGTSGQYEPGTVISDNEFVNQYESAIYIRYQHGVKILHNTVESNSTNTGYRGIYINRTSGIWQVENNKVLLSGLNGGTGIYLNTCNSVTDTWGGFINNFVVINSNGNNVFGIRIYNGTWLSLYYNSVLVFGDLTTGCAINISGTAAGSNQKIKNNIFVNDANGYAVYCESTEGFTTDYNNLVSSGSNLAYWNGNITDLAAWKTASSQAANSISIDPLFISDTDLHVSNTGLKSGESLSYPSVDIDDEVRDGASPCIGADEFVYPALGGIYTIGTSGFDYSSFNEAVAALANGGVRDEVIFEVQPGIYNEQITIPAIDRVSVDKPITFRSATADSTLVTLTYSPTGTGDNFTMKLDSVSHLNFEHLTFTTGGTAYGSVINIINGISEVVFSNNRIIGSQSAETNDGKLVDGTDGSKKVNTSFINNYLQYGSSGLELYGGAGTGIKIIDNLFQDLAYWNIRLNQCDSIFVDNNLIRSDLTTDFSGMFFFYCDSGLTVRNNQLYAPTASSSTGIYFYKSNASESYYSLIANNVIRLLAGGASNSALYSRESSHCLYYYNTVDFSGSATTSKIVYIRGSGTDLYYKNNTLSNHATGYGFYSELISGIESDNNNLFTTGSNLSFWNSANQSDLTAWQTASDLDANSLSVDPLFPTADDPHFPNPALNDAGTPLTEVTVDIDGEMRDPATPDIGADEFCLPPVADDKPGCTTRIIPDLTASGSSIKWYADRGLTSFITAGSSLATGHTNAGSYKYYVTQTINESESQADSATLTIYTTPGIPPASDSAICAYETTPDFTAAGTDLKWYSDPVLSTQVGSGTNYASGVSGAGTYTFYVTQTTNGCMSDANTSILTIHPQPDPPDGDIAVSCFGDNVPDLTVTGENVQWYSDEALTNMVNTGNTFSTGDTLAAYYYYYPTQTVLGCESGPGYDTLRIKERPDLPVSDSQAVCIGESIPDLTATGSSINWYSDAGRSSLLHSGDSYSTGMSGIGIYPYYVTQSIEGCESLNNMVVLMINGLPDPFVLANQVSCHADTQEYYLGTTVNAAHSYSWTSSEADLNSSESNPVVKPLSPGLYKYFLVETIDSTGCNATDSMTITITSDPAASVLDDQVYCNSEIRAYNIGAAAIGGNTYLWVSKPSGFSSAISNPSVTPTDTITYILTETIIATGCTMTDSIIFTINQNPDASVIADRVLCHSDTGNIGIGAPAVPGNSYYWTSSQGDLSSGEANPIVNPLNPGTYKYYLVETVNLTGCQSTDSVTITINSDPAATVLSDQVYCQSEIKDFDIGASTVGGNSYSWVSGPPGFTSTESNPNVTPEYSTTYILTETITTTGCKKSDSVVFTINANPIKTVHEDSNVCQSDTQDIVIILPITQGHSYAWTSSQGDLNSNEPNPTIRPTQTGTYKYFLIESVDLTGCWTADTFVIFINTNPVASVISDQVYCRSEAKAYQVGATAVPGNSYSWVSVHAAFVSSEANPSVTPTESIIYKLTETIDITGCVMSDSVVFIVNPNPNADVIDDEAVCHSAVHPFSIGSAAIPGNNYSWTSSAGDLTSAEANPVASPTTPGSYRYYLTETIDATSCDKSDTVTITVNPNPVIGVTADKYTINRDSSTALIASGTLNYTWSPALGLSDSVGSPVSASPDENITYYLEGSNEFGCMEYDSIDIAVYCPSCGQEEPYFTSEGTFNFGCTNNLYKNNLDCSWTLLPSGVGKLYLLFDTAKFDIQAGDWIWVYNGLDNTSDTIGRYNNEKLPPPRIEGGSALHIRFTTDNSGTGMGFQAEWSNDPSIGFSTAVEEQFRIFPNPAKNKLIVEINSLPAGEIRMLVYNQVGQLVLSRQWEHTGDHIKHEVDINGLESGVYIIKIVNSDNSYTRSIFKE